MASGARTLRSIVLLGALDLLVVSAWLFFRIATVPKKAGSQPSSILQVLHLQATPQCNPQEHVVFVKVQKAGSSTVQNIFYRFGTNRNLTFMLPKYGNYISYSTCVKDREVMSLPVFKDRYDISCNHVKYNRTAFEKYMHPDTSYVGIIRHPLTLLNSYIYYFLEHVVPGKDKLEEFLRDPDHYAGQRNVSFNLLTNYFGLSSKRARNSTEVKMFTNQIDKEFHIMLVLELIDESLLLMKRQFCWNLTDILYIRKNARDGTPSVKNATMISKDKHRTIADADYTFYRHFHKKMQDKVFQEGLDFQKELLYFRQVREAVRKYCTRQLWRVDGPLRFPSSPWQTAFMVTSETCQLMDMPELKFQDIVGSRQYGPVWKAVHRSQLYH
ncbi:galactosylceramide sulfotransferase-like [Liolophura sinensis]|uniref:galactosylceramide sulfotransferase-like n=1 Tax=Liolophura sinensis TaxID=3198878 RepID=UPI0031587814